MHPLLAELARRPLLCDGAMGTELIARGLRLGECCVRWNVDRADTVRDVHNAYVDAGCDCITTNTFGASEAALERHGLSHRAAELNRAGAAIARQIAGEDRWVLGNIGPFGGFLKPAGAGLSEDVLAMFTRQAIALRDGGCDAIIIETMVDPAEMRLAILAAKSVADWPVLATFTFQTDGKSFRTIAGTKLAPAIENAINTGADVVGANCGTGIDLSGCVGLARDLVSSAGSVPVILQPNAGEPTRLDAGFVYPVTPTEMAALVPKLVGVGCQLIGGCCGTTPAHLRLMHSALRSHSNFPARGC